LGDRQRKSWKKSNSRVAQTGGNQSGGLGKNQKKTTTVGVTTCRKGGTARMRQGHYPEKQLEEDVAVEQFAKGHRKRVEE